MVFVYQRTVHFGETDAAGVVYFANVLTICHEAYEASLEQAGIHLGKFFGKAAVAFPIVHASVDFLRPLGCGDRLVIHLHPEILSQSEFEIRYTIFANAQLDRPASQALTRHVCIDAAARKRQDLSAEITQWLAQWRAANAPERSP